MGLTQPDGVGDAVNASHLKHINVAFAPTRLLTDGSTARLHQAAVARDSGQCDFPHAASRQTPKHVNITAFMVPRSIVCNQAGIVR